MTRANLISGEPGTRIRFLVIIGREGVASVYPFDDEGDARAFLDTAGANWSDAYLARVLVGPQFRAEEPALTDRERACLRGEHEPLTAEDANGVFPRTFVGRLVALVCRHCRAVFVARSA